MEKINNDKIFYFKSLKDNIIRQNENINFLLQSLSETEYNINLLKNMGEKEIYNKYSLIMSIQLTDFWKCKLDNNNNMLFSIDSKLENLTYNTKDTRKETLKFYKWKQESKDDYISKIKSNEIVDQISNLSNLLKHENNTSADSIDSSIGNFINIIDQVCAPMFEKSVKGCSNDNNHNKHSVDNENSDNFVEVN